MLTDQQVFYTNLAIYYPSHDKEKIYSELISHL